MSLGSRSSVPVRATRRRLSEAALLLDGDDSSNSPSPSPSPPLLDSPRQRLLVKGIASRKRPLLLKACSGGSSTKRRAVVSALERSVTMSSRKLSKMRSIVRHWKKLARVSSSPPSPPSPSPSVRQKRRYLSLGGEKKMAEGEREPERKSNFGGGDCFFGSSAAATLSDLEDGDSDGDDGDRTRTTGPEKSVRRLARSAAAGAGAPDGCLALFVGREKRRFVVGAHYLEHTLFRGLLERSAAEFGLDQKGGIRIACEVVLFEHLLWLIGTDDPSTRHLQVDELLDFYAY